MNKVMRLRYGWTDEDLTASAVPTIKEDDPWAALPQNANTNDQPTKDVPTAQSGDEQPEAVYIGDFDDAGFLGTPTRLYDDSLPPLVLDDDADGVDTWDEPEPQAEANSELAGDEQPEAVYIGDFDDAGFLGTPTRLYDDSLPPLVLDDDADGVDTWDEPEPQAEANSELNERLYPPDNDVTDLPRVLKISELISRIKPITNDQQRGITALLEEFSVKHLRIWLPWLHKQKWSGHSLLLFLQFRNIWNSDCNARWWENSFWHPGLECWYPRFSRGNLTRYAMYRLIQRRLHRSPNCGPNEVINEDWFEEWNSFALYTRGFPSFASFAVFRAKFDDGKEWRQYVDVSDDVEEDEDDEFGNGEEWREYIESAWKDVWKALL